MTQEALQLGLETAAHFQHCRLQCKMYMPRQAKTKNRFELDKAFGNFCDTHAPNKCVTSLLATLVEIFSFELFTYFFFPPFEIVHPNELPIPAVLPVHLQCTTPPWPFNKSD